jgi:hypothetical protein
MDMHECTHFEDEEVSTWRDIPGEDALPISDISSSSPCGILPLTRHMQINNKPDALPLTRSDTGDRGT